MALWWEGDIVQSKSCHELREKTLKNTKIKLCDLGGNLIRGRTHGQTGKHI